MSDFSKFGRLVDSNLMSMSVGELFEVNISPDELWQAYLAAFPPGSNEVYRKRTEHDCSCCRNFVKNVGNVVSLSNGQVLTVWVGHELLEYPYDMVAQRMDALVRDLPITRVFRTKEIKYGNMFTREYTGTSPSGDAQSVKTWHHFHGTIDLAHQSSTPDKASGELLMAKGVFERGLRELTLAAFDTVLEHIDHEHQPLYRGAEFRAAVAGFRELQQRFDALGDPLKENHFVWLNAHLPIAKFKNTAIGVLVEDLSQGMDEDRAVRAFESKVAPTNYKRPTAVITKSMVDDAMKTIKGLGLEDSLQRRYAKLSDITVNNVLWVDVEARQSMMRSPLENALMEAAVTRAPKKVSASSIGIDEFMRDVLPTVTSMEMMVKGSQLSNLVSLTAPVHPDCITLFKWGNDFAWSYDGNITDSNIKERVKQAGGNVTNAALRVSLAWFNFDDLDIYVTEPNGNIICFHNKDGKQDVDMNAGSNRSRTPVENVSWTPNKLRDGEYEVQVNQYFKRETIDDGFQIEIENQGRLYHLSYAPAVKGRVDVCTITVTNGAIEKIEPAKNIVGGGFSQEKWGIKTETMVRVETLLHSPNFWDGQQIGNKHWIFALQGCRNPDPTRGIYNEFLVPELDKHRKVFEVLGDKTKCPRSEEQISGLGFSRHGETVTVRVKGPNMLSNLEINF